MEHLFSLTWQKYHTRVPWPTSYGLIRIHKKMTLQYPRGKKSTNHVTMRDKSLITTTNHSGAGYTFGSGVVYKFLETNNMSHILRAHQLCMEGPRHQAAQNAGGKVCYPIGLLLSHVCFWQHTLAMVWRIGFQLPEYTRSQGRSYLLGVPLVAVITEMGYTIVIRKGHKWSDLKDTSLPA